MKRFALITGALALLLTAVVVQAQLSRDFANEFLAQPAGRALVQTFGALKTGYLEDVDDDAIIRGAITGMLEAVGDPFTYYLEPRTAAREAQDRSGTFEGIGAVLTPFNRQTGRGVEILNVYRGGPAYQAGVQRGDIFLEVDGVDVSDFTTTEVVDLVRGPGGTTVEITFRRPGAEAPVSFAIVRDTIEIVDVTAGLVDGDVGYVAISSFGNQRVYDQLMDALARLQLEGATSFVLDLRNNPGGLLTQGILVADEFLGDGDIVFQRARGVTQRLASADPRGVVDAPMAVLVNRNSASASEIVAGALQDNHRALVIGETTFGKGVAQSVVSLSDGGQLAYTSFEWLTPDRRSISAEGVVPDLSVIDTLLTQTISIDGRGGEVGQVVTILVDGVEVGSTEVAEDGEFTFVTTGPRPVLSEVQGEALVDLENDAVLAAALVALRDGSAAALGSR
ncbi:MAG: S41 family peptidase [Trueperaceae bacterium]|nr:S41 family peptidase [Trueperaceae bacterium]